MRLWRAGAAISALKQYRFGRTADQDGRGTEVSPADGVGIDCGLKVDLSRTAVAVQLMVKHQITSNLKLKIRLP